MRSLRRIRRLHHASTLPFVALVGLGLEACTESPVATGRAAVPARAHIALAPVFSPAAANVLAQRGAFPSVTFDHVHVTLLRSATEKVADTTVAFTPQSPDLSLELTVPVQGEGEQFTAIIDYVNLGVSEYHGQGPVQSHADGQAGTSPQQVPVQYVGPGANAARVTISPKTSTLLSPATLAFTASVFDASGAALSNVPLAWSVSDPTAGTISTTGVFTPSGKRATVTITARTPTNVADAASLSVTLPASAVTLVSGGGQSGRVGAALPQSATVRVVASDGVGIPGAIVSFTAPAGGQVGSSSVVADASGNATTSLTLGTVSGRQTFSASAAGFSVSIPETAIPDNPAAIVAVSGGGQSDTVKHALKNPLIAKVSDRFGNGVPNVTVTWARTAGAGQLTATSSSTDSAGFASVGYTLGDSTGIATITASAPGVNTPASFTVRATGNAVIALSATTMHFTGTQGAGSPASQTITISNAGSGALSGIVVTVAYPGAANWLQATLSGTVANPTATLTVQPTIGTLGPGTYSAQVEVSSNAATNSPQILSVSFTVLASPPTIVLSSSSLNFSGVQNGLDPAAQSIAISNGGGGTLSGLTVASINYGSGAKGWIQDSLSSAIAPATLRVSAVASPLAPGNYAATVTLAASTASNSPRTISVALTVAAPSCANASQLRSLNSDTPATMQFSNRSSEVVSVYWIDFNGARVLYNTLQPASQYQQATFLTHPWIVIGASGKCYGVWLPPATAIAQ